MNTERLFNTRIERWSMQYPRASTAAMLVFVVGLLVIGGLLDGAA